MRSPLASFLFKGLATKHRTVKWTIEDAMSSLQICHHPYHGKQKKNKTKRNDEKTKHIDRKTENAEYRQYQPNVSIYEWTGYVL